MSYGYGGCLEQRPDYRTAGCTFSYRIYEQIHGLRNMFSDAFAFAPILSYLRISMGELVACRVCW